MIFTADRLRQLCPQVSPLTVDMFAAALEEFALGAGVVTPLTRAHLMAQLAEESAGFTQLSENLKYSAGRITAVWPRLEARAEALAYQQEALANAVYGGRLGNGHEACGDGWRYRGRGLIQITGRANYLARQHALGFDLIGDPDEAAEPELAVRIALSFWTERGCNGPAERDDAAAVTQLINGGINGLAARQVLTDQAKGIFT